MKKIITVFTIFILCCVCFCSCDLFPCKHTESVDAAVAPTCTEGGLTEGKHCSKCGEVLVAQQMVAPLGHTEKLEESKAPTCTEDGYTAAVSCSVCGVTIIEKEIIPASHTYGEWKQTSESDCFFEGERERACTVCEHIDTDKLPANTHSFVQNPDSGLFSCEKCEATIFAGHLYATFDVEVNWYEAYSVCEEIGGYLVTITSQREQAFINYVLENKDYSFVTDSEYLYHTGGMLNSNGWMWVNGEEFDYTYWGPQGLDNTNNNWIVALTTSFISSANAQMKIGEWETNPIWFTEGFICEWELDINESDHYFTEWNTVTEVSCFADGEEYRFCTHCGLEETRTVKQLEHSFVLDEATGLTSCEHCDAGLYDGRIYKTFIVELSWFDAYKYCQNLGGHLVTITSEDEQIFIENYMEAQSFTQCAWIGLYFDDSKWMWITGEEFEYSNWAEGEPNDSGAIEAFGHVNWLTNGGKWNDFAPLPNTVQSGNTIAFICEWEVN